MPQPQGLTSRWLSLVRFGVSVLPARNSHAGGLTQRCVVTDTENLKAANKESFPFFNQVCGPVLTCSIPCKTA